MDEIIIEGEENSNVVYSGVEIDEPDYPGVDTDTDTDTDNNEPPVVDSGDDDFPGIDLPDIPGWNTDDDSDNDTDDDGASTVDIDEPDHSDTDKEPGILKRMLGAVLLFCCFFLINSCAYSAINKDGYGFFRTGDMLNVRQNTQAVLLKDGRVFISGGWDTSEQLWYNRALKSTEIYDPKTGTFSYGPDLNVPRERHTMLTMDDGRVLIAGGSGYSYMQNGSHDPVKKEKYSHIEIYDPKTNTIVLGPKLVENSRYQNAQILNIGDGEYLIGTRRNGVPGPKFLIYNSKNNTIDLFHCGLKEIGNISYMTYLGNNEIAFFNFDTFRVNIVNKKTGKVIRTAKPKLPRFMSVVALLDDGRVILFEGRHISSKKHIEVYIPKINNFNLLENVVFTTKFNAFKLSDNKVVLKSIGATEIFDANTNKSELKDYNIAGTFVKIINLSDNTALCLGNYSRFGETTKKSYLLKY